MRGRRGFTLIEIAVVVAILVVMAVVAVPALSGLLDLQQRAAAKELAQTYTWLVDEAQLRNVTFRVVYNLDRRTWKIEVGDPDTVVFATPEEREAHDEEVREMMRRYTEEEIAQGVPEDEEEGGSQLTDRFAGLDADGSFTTERSLPRGTAFAFVYTPQYGEEGVRPHDPEDLADLDPEDERVAYTYVFSDGTAEHTVVRIVDEDDMEDGWTLEVEPLSGKVHLSTDIVDPQQSMAWLPDEGPRIW